MGRLVGNQVTARVQPRGLSGKDTPALIAGMVARDGGPLTREGGFLFYKNETAIKPGRKRWQCCETG